MGDALTLEALLASVRPLLDLPPNPLAGVNELRCCDTMLADARRLRDDAFCHQRSPFTGGTEHLYGVRIVASAIVPPGFIVAMKPGKNGPEVAFIVGPEKAKT
ncbi:hypothetical protein [Mesorhizobium sp. LNJC391B00]|uniref:hypothetical protein n=1 Tax=Mesorhizobium sp. LNJC391B00 TaxID=1287273 RepID=UPI0003CE4B58|nr:hypothetical protein [Mesorhizobium sp. LNJC391B00]ESY21523.1 hypothetical protein X749_27920 [Mesorhizobium sp. LNJC391B00]